MALEKRLPERQVYFRTNGVVKFKSLSTTIQLTGFGFVGMFALWVVMVSVNYLTRDIVMEARDHQINEISEEYARALGDIEILQQRLLSRVDTLDSRQDFLQNVMAGDPLQGLNIKPVDDVTVDDASSGSDMGLDPIDRLASLSFTPDALKNNQPHLYAMDVFVNKTEQRLQTVADSQQGIAQGLITLADTRMADIDERIASTGLKSSELASYWNGASEIMGVGGPYLPTTNHKLLETRLLNEPTPEALIADPFLNTHKELSTTWLSMQKAHDTVSSIPAIEPAADFYISSRFGRRIDPFKKKTAVHYGLDMAGWPGTKIYSTATGTVVKAGTNGAYGRMVEVDHGNGFKTRYGHMKRVRVKIGQIVKRGDIVGDMGCTGRCTSTHLHYEVWFGGKPRNPMPYVRKAQSIIELENTLNNIDTSVALEDE